MPTENAPPDVTPTEEDCYPEEGEGQDEFMTRCMGHEGMTGDFADEGERHGACELRWAKAQTPVPATASFPLIRGVSGGEFTLEASASEGGQRAFSMLAYTGVPMKLDGFHHKVIVDLSSMHAPRQSIPTLRQHDPERIAGHTTSVEVSAQRIRIAGVLSGMEDHTRDLVHTSKGGFPWQASIGAMPSQMEFIPKGESAKVNGRNWDGPLFVARGAVLREVSLVPMGADGNTAAAIAATLGTGEGKMEFDTWLASVGFDKAKLSDQQVKTLEASWRAQTVATDRKPDSFDEKMAAIEAENARQDYIRGATEAAAP